MEPTYQLSWLVVRDALAQATAMDKDEGLATIDNIVTQFSTYEDFLDSQITTVDLYYLEVRSAAASPCGPRVSAELCPLAVTRTPVSPARERPLGGRITHWVLPQEQHNLFGWKQAPILAMKKTC